MTDATKPKKPRRTLTSEAAPTPEATSQKQPEPVIMPIDLFAFIAAAFDDFSQPVKEAPTAVIILGAPAAGKTTLRKAQYARGHVVIDAAEVFLRLCQGKELDFPGELEEPMQLLGQMIAKQAIEERRNIVTEVIPLQFEVAEELIGGLKGAGYRTRVVGVNCSLEECNRRNENRGPEDISAYFAERYQMRWIVDACRGVSGPR